ALERPSKVFLGGYCSALLSLRQQKLTLDPQQLGQVPAFIPGFATRQRLVNERETLPCVPGLAETCRQLAVQKQKARQEGCITSVLECAMQRLQAAGTGRASLSPKRRSRVPISATGESGGARCARPPSPHAVQ